MSIAHRQRGARRPPLVHDYLNANVPVLKAQYTRRRTAYRQMGFTD